MVVNHTIGIIDNAQICLNEHVINSMARTYPSSDYKYCDECGAEIITACQKCNTPILGAHHTPDRGIICDYSPPQFCHDCGEPFPWTKSKLETAKELANRLEGLSERDRDMLKESIENLIKDSPRTKLAEVQFKLIMKKVGSDSYEIMKKIPS